MKTFDDRPRRAGRLAYVQRQPGYNYFRHPLQPKRDLPAIEGEPGNETPEFLAAYDHCLQALLGKQAKVKAKAKKKDATAIGSVAYAVAHYLRSDNFNKGKATGALTKSNRARTLEKIA